MGRIVYISFPNGNIAGGQKVSIRHVEVLNDLGYNAIMRVHEAANVPGWIEHRIEIERGTPIKEGDVLVIPEDAPHAVRGTGQLPNKRYLFNQNHLVGTSVGLAHLSADEVSKLTGIIACSRTVARLMARMYPSAQIDIVPAFADERVFKPGPAREHIIAVVPRKRPTEARFIQHVFRVTQPAHRRLPWRVLQDAPELEVADTFGRADLYVSLSRLEGLGMTTLEAMASGCIVAGFTGVGGREYATKLNGFWVEDDDCEAAVDALGAAADLVSAGGAPLEQMRLAARETAARWSYERFREALSRFWSGAAPEARRLPGAA